eukprot:5763643-Amphidinium_carterae.2
MKSSSLDDISEIEHLQLEVVQSPALAGTNIKLIAGLAAWSGLSLWATGIFALVNPRRLEVLGAFSHCWRQLVRLVA